MNPATRWMLLLQIALIATGAFFRDWFLLIVPTICGCLWIVVDWRLVRRVED